MRRLFSIIVPVYNIEKYIEECIVSIIKQNYVDWELILIDDGSTDSSAETCIKYSKDDERIHYYYKENSGQSDARNMGIAKANGDYLLFVDGDDYITPEALESVCAVCEMYGNPQIIISDGMYEVNEGTRVRKVINHIEAGGFQGITGYDALMQGIEGGLTWSPCGKAYNKEYWNKNNFCFPRGRISEDLALIPKVLLKSNRVACVSSFYTYRRYRNGSSASYSIKKMVRDDIKCFDDWELYFVNEDVNKELIVKFRKRFLKLYNHNSMAYLYLFKGDERAEVISDIKRYRFLLEYASSTEEKIIRLFVEMFGLETTCYILGVIKRRRLSRLLQDN